ncbi:MAG: phage scaffolding protein [Bacilli bacterium]
MKRDFLKELGIDEEVVNKIMAEHGKTVEKTKGEASKATQDLEKYKEEAEGLKTQLTDANTQIQSFKEMDIEGIKKSADEWKSKYETDTENLNKQLADKDCEYSLNKYLDDYKFANDRVKSSIAQELKSKGFKLDNGTLLGADDYMKQLKENEPTSFINEEPPNNPLPQIIKPGGGVTPPGSSGFGFGSMFTGVRAKENTN